MEWWSFSIIIRLPRVTWTGDRGESWYIPTEKSIKNILHTFKLGGILYREGIPDFSLCAKITVSIENMSEIRRENFQQCDVTCAEEWSLKKYGGKSKWTPSDVQKWRKENGYTWHERNDMATCDLVPIKINRFFGHLGGVSECKKCREVWDGCFDIKNNVRRCMKDLPIDYLYNIIIMRSKTGKRFAFCQMIHLRTSITKGGMSMENLRKGT